MLFLFFFPCFFPSSFFFFFSPPFASFLFQHPCCFLDKHQGIRGMSFLSSLSTAFLFFFFSAFAFNCFALAKLCIDILFLFSIAWSFAFRCFWRSMLSASWSVAVHSLCSIITVLFFFSSLLYLFFFRLFLYFTRVLKPFLFAFFFFVPLCVCLYVPFVSPNSIYSQSLTQLSGVAA